MSCIPAAQIEASAVVLDNAPGRVRLAVTRQSACGSCAEKSHCGSQHEKPKPQTIWLANTSPLPLGQTVAVTLPEQALLHATLLMYGLPLSGFLGGMLAGAGFNDRTAILASLAGLAAGFGLAAGLSRRLIAPLRLQNPLEKVPVHHGVHQYD